MDAITSRTPAGNSGRDNLETMGLVEACYCSLHERRRVLLSEFAAEEER